MKVKIKMLCICLEYIAWYLPGDVLQDPINKSRFKILNWTPKMADKVRIKMLSIMFPETIQYP